MRKVLAIILNKKSIWNLQNSLSLFRNNYIWKKRKQKKIKGLPWKIFHHFDFKMLALLQTLVHIELIDGCYASQFFKVSFMKIPLHVDMEGN